MSENAASMDIDRTNPISTPPVISAGTLLRQARESAGLHVAALAVSLKVPVKKLEALENDRLDLLPDAVFARALASSMCRALKVDSAPILERLPLTAVPRLSPDDHSINTPFHAPGERARGSVLDQLSKPVVLVVLVLLIAALIMILFPSIKSSAEGQASAPDQKPTESAGTAANAVTPVAPMIQSVPLALVVPVAPAGLPQSVASSSPPLVVSAQLALPNGGVATPDPLASPSAPVASAIPPQGSGSVAGLVLLKAKGTSWVEVTDGNGVVQVRKTLGAGESVSASGTLPLSVVVGRVDNTEAQVRGKDYDLNRIARDNVAKFEVK